MNSEHLKQPEVQKLLHSIQCAFPVQEDPWQDLSIGIGLSRDEIQELWNHLVEDNVILGLRLEIDPQHPEYSEWLMPATDSPEGFLPRQQLLGDDLSYFSILQSSKGASDPKYAEYAWPSVSWKKVGTFFHTTKQKSGDLLGPMTERTFSVNDQIYQQSLPFSDDQRSAMETFSSATAIHGGEPIWKQLGQVLNITNMDYVREVVSKILLSKRARRFHAVLNPEVLGYKTCTLMGWRVDESQAHNAASALASIRASADVTVRKPTPKFPGNVSALLIAPDSDSMKVIQSTIAEKWKIEPVIHQELRWLPSSLS